MPRKISILLLLVLLVIAPPALAQDETPTPEGTLEPTIEILPTDAPAATPEMTLVETPTIEVSPTPDSTPATAEPTPLTVDEQVDAVAVDIDRVQPEYYAITGRYLQILPTDGTDLNAKPTDGPLSPAEVGLIIEPGEVTFAVDEYDGPYGQGYIIRAWSTQGGEPYEMAVHHGSDPAFDSFPWRLANDSPY